MLAKTATFSDPLALSVPKHTLRKTGSGRRGQGRRGQGRRGQGRRGQGRRGQGRRGQGRRGQGTNSGQATESGNQFSISDSPTILSPEDGVRERIPVKQRNQGTNSQSQTPQRSFPRNRTLRPALVSAAGISFVALWRCLRSAPAARLACRVKLVFVLHCGGGSDKGTKAQRHKGTKAQRHKGTKAQRDKGTESDKGFLSGPGLCESRADEVAPRSACQSGRKTESGNGVRHGFRWQ